MERHRVPALLAGILSFVLAYFAYKASEQWSLVPRELLMSSVRGILCWSWLVAICGFASRYLRFSNGFLKYANEAVLPFYILHQMVILSIGFYVIRLHTHLWLEYLIIATSLLRRDHGDVRAVHPPSERPPRPVRHESYPPRAACAGTAASSICLMAIDDDRTSIVARAFVSPGSIRKTKALPMANGQTIGKLALAAATQNLTMRREERTRNRCQPGFRVMRRAMDSVKEGLSRDRRPVGWSMSSCFRTAPSSGLSHSACHWPGGRVERQGGWGAAFHVQGVGLAGGAEDAGYDAGAGLDEVTVRLELRQVEGMEEIAEDLELLAQGRAAAAGGLVRDIGAILVADREAVIEAVEQAASAEQEVPGLSAVGGIGPAGKARTRRIQ